MSPLVQGLTNCLQGQIVNLLDSAGQGTTAEISRKNKRKIPTNFWTKLKILFIDTKTKISYVFHMP